MPRASASSDHSISSLHGRAIADLRFIREAMHAASAYTAFSGWGLIAIGVAALLSAWIAGRQGSAEGHTAIWIATAALGVCIGFGSSLYKARRAGQRLLGAPVRKFTLCFVPVLVAGALLTLFTVRQPFAVVFPALWMLLYGAGLIAAGSMSVRVIPAMGACFFVLGTAALVLPEAWGDALMACGFGGVHIAGGAVIAAKYGG